SAWITHGCEQRDISRFINSSNADWKPPYAINGTYGGVRGGESPLLDYERCGYCRLPFAHVQMPFAPQLPPVPMELLSFPYAMTETEVLRFKSFLETTVMRYRERSVDS
ncbi:MAG: hypothetical protein IJA63_10045, partial [Akkermansia sp.]|nr:hypothetical protein [Akkermansia sp.]